VQAQVDLALEMAARPTVLGGLGGVPNIKAWIVAAGVHEDLVMGPTDLCSQWLHFLRLGPQRRESAHVEQVAPREPTRRAGLCGKILRDPTHHIVPPVTGVLLVENLATNPPVERDELGVESARRAGLGPTDALHQTVDQVAVGRRCGNHLHLASAVRNRRVAHGREDTPSFGWDAGEHASAMSPCGGCPR